jgi:hypothetical protein
MSVGNVSRRRWWIWLPLLGLAGWLALFGDKSPDGKAAALSVPVRRPPTAEAVARSFSVTASKPAIGAEPEALEQLVPRDQWRADAPPPGTASAARQDIFLARNWNPPPPPPPAVVETPPAPPPLPFIFLGKKLEGATWEVYLSRGEQSFIAREGQTLEGVYRVDKIAPPTLFLTYVPLGQSQALTIGETR